MCIFVWVCIFAACCRVNVKSGNLLFFAEGFWIGLATLLDTVASIFFLYVTPSDGAPDEARRISCVSAAIVLLVLSILGVFFAGGLTCCRVWPHVRHGQVRAALLAICNQGLAVVVVFSNGISIGAAAWLLANHHKCADVRVQSMIVFPTLASAIVSTAASCCVPRPQQQQAGFAVLGPEQQQAGCAVPQGNQQRV